MAKAKLNKVIRLSAYCRS